MISDPHAVAERTRARHLKEDRARRRRNAAPVSEVVLEAVWALNGYEGICRASLNAIHEHVETINPERSWTLADVRHALAELRACGRVLSADGYWTINPRNA